MRHEVQVRTQMDKGQLLEAIQAGLFYCLITKEDLVEQARMAAASELETELLSRFGCHAKMQIEEFAIDLDYFAQVRFGKKSVVATVDGAGVKDIEILANELGLKLADAAGVA